MDGKSLDVGVVIVSYHSEGEINALLRSLDEGQRKRDFKVVVVSNSGPAKGLDNADKLLFIESPGNIGFGRGCNLGVSQLDTRYILFVNPDVRITSDIVATLIKLMEQNPDFGAIAPFWSPEQSAQIVFEPTGKVIEIPQVNIGACFLMRRDFFQQIGEFDPNIFLWWEDTELRDRILDNGKKIGFAEGIGVIHSEGHSTNPSEQSGRAYLTQVWICSHAYYLIKRKGVLAALLWCAGMVGANLMRIFTGSGALRRYHSPQTAVTFGLRLLANSYRLRKFVTFDGQGYLWN